MPDSEKIGFPGRGGKQAGVSCVRCVFYSEILPFKKNEAGSGKGTAGETRNTEAFRVRLFPPQKLHFCIQGASSAERATKSGSVASL